MNTRFGRIVHAAILLVLLILIYVALRSDPKNDHCRHADGTFDHEVCDGPGDE